ncbi:hypothetical protein [Actinomadura monticuli]|uniref:VWA domain-containing protein n=1 Tax=Actinomadura monticuli TaxID=3097367 RepID=A0ABV4QII1_9ACTN
MSESGDGDRPPGAASGGRDHDPAGPGDPPGLTPGPGPAPGEIPPSVIIGVCSGVIVTVLMKQVYAVPWLGTLVTAIVTVAAFVLLGWLATRDPVKSVLKRLFPRVPAGAATALGWGAAGATAMLLILTSVVGVGQLLKWTRPCGQPLELRVLANPATIRPLRSAAAEFENESRDHGCSEYSVSVAGEPGPVRLRTAFRQQWPRNGAAGDPPTDNDRLFGPQPDIWIPSSEEEFDYVKGVGGGAGTPSFVKKSPSLGLSPMTLALFGEDHTVVNDLRALPVATDIGDLLNRFASAGLKLRGIARPVPETSAVALAVTPALYARTQDTDNREDERFAEPADMLAPDAVSLLCRFREQAEEGLRPPKDIAVAVPEQLLSDYDFGLPLGDDQCKGLDLTSREHAAWRLYPHYSADLPTLDHPFVQVTWPGQRTSERSDAVRAFHDWLMRNPLTAQGFRDGEGTYPATDLDDPAPYSLSRLVADRRFTTTLPDKVPPKSPDDVQSALAVISKARPKVSLSLMLDVSGSMGGTARGRAGTRLAQGASFMQSLVTQLQDSDNAALRVSSSEQVPKGDESDVPPPVSPESKNDILRRLQDATPKGSDRSLSTMLEDARIGSERTNLVLVTDGQVGSTRKDLSAGTLSGEYRAKHRDMRLVVVMAGPAGCGASPVKDLVAALRGGGGAECLALSTDPKAQERQAAELMVNLRLGGGD